MSVNKRGRGRPCLDPGGTPSKFLTIRASDTECESYRDAAKKSDQPLSAWIRSQLNRAAKRESKRDL
jgi:hypothetical protein